MERCELKAEAKKRHTIMYKITLLEKDIKISNPERFMWTQTKQNYERHVEQMENQNDIVEEKDWAFKARFFFFFLMDWQAPMPNVMLEFFNTS